MSAQCSASRAIAAVSTFRTSPIFSSNASLCVRITSSTDRVALSTNPLLWLSPGAAMFQHSRQVSVESGDLTHEVQDRRLAIRPEYDSAVVPTLSHVPQQLLGNPLHTCSFERYGMRDVDTCTPITVDARNLDVGSCPRSASSTARPGPPCRSSPGPLCRRTPSPS